MAQYGWPNRTSFNQRDDSLFVPKADHPHHDPDAIEMPVERCTKTVVVCFSVSVAWTAAG